MTKRYLDPKDDPEAVRMRLLRRAEGFGDSAARWAHYLGWTVTALNNYETGFRRVPRDAAMKLYQKIPGFNPIWLWTGNEDHISFDLRQRLRKAEAAEEEEKGLRSAKG